MDPTPRRHLAMSSDNECNTAGEDVFRLLEEADRTA
jgi:hypothetical protein